MISRRQKYGCGFEGEQKSREQKDTGMGGFPRLSDSHAKLVRCLRARPKPPTNRASFNISHLLPCWCGAVAYRQNPNQFFSLSHPTLPFAKPERIGTNNEVRLFLASRSHRSVAPFLHMVIAPRKTKHSFQSADKKTLERNETRLAKNYLTPLHSLK